MPGGLTTETVKENDWLQSEGTGRKGMAEFMSQDPDEDGGYPEQGRLHGVSWPDKIGGEEEKGLDSHGETENAKFHHHQGVRVSCAGASCGVSRVEVR